MTRRHQLQSLPISLLRWIKRPSTIALSVSAIALGTVGYGGELVLINKYLPILIEIELSKTLFKPKGSVRIEETAGLNLLSIMQDRETR